MKLYGSYISPFTVRVMVLVRAKGLDIPLLDPPGRLHSAEYQALTALDKIPVLDVDGRIIVESEVICDFLEESFQDTNFSGSDPLEKARARTIARIFDLYVMNAMLPVFKHLDPNTRDQTVVETAIANVRHGLTNAESFLEGGNWATLNRLTIADCMAAPVLLYCNRFLPMLGTEDWCSDLPKISSYWAALQKDERIAPLMGKMTEALGG